jgi:hypothetical protein
VHSCRNRYQREARESATKGKKMRSFKILGASLAIALCFGAVTAPASLAVPQLHSEAGHTILTGESLNNELALDVGVFQCVVMRFDGTLQAQTGTTFSLTPTFENCVVDGMEAVFTHNECNWRFHVGPNEEHLTGSVDFVCPEGQEMGTHSLACDVTIPPQLNLQGVTYTNEGAGATRSVILDIKLVGIDYVEHGMGCPNQTETTNNGIYEGKVTLTGENVMGAHRGIWVE